MLAARLERGFNKILWITDGRKEGIDEDFLRKRKEKFKMDVIDLSGGKIYKNAWIERVEPGDIISVDIKGNDDFEVLWEMKTDTSDMKGKVKLNDGRGKVLIDQGNFKFGMMRIYGDSLEIDNFYFFLKKEKEKRKVGLFNFSPAEIPYMDEGFYIKNALTKAEGFEISEKIPPFKNEEAEKYSFIFLLNPEWNEFVKELLTRSLKEGIPLFISSGERGSFEKICEYTGIKVRGIKEFNAERKFIPEKVHPIFNNFSKEDLEIVYETFIKMAFIFDMDSNINPIISLSTGEPLLFQLNEKPIFFLATTSDIEWSSFPISGIFVPLIIDLLNKFSIREEEIIHTSTPFDSQELKSFNPVYKNPYGYGIYRSDGGKVMVSNFSPTDESMLTPYSYEINEKNIEVIATKKAFLLWKYAIIATALFIAVEALLLK